MTHGCLCSNKVYGYVKGIFLFLHWLQHVVPLCLLWPLAQPFPTAWEGSMGQCSVYLSYSDGYVCRPSITTLYMFFPVHHAIVTSGVKCYKTVFFVTDNCSRNKLVFVLDNNYQAPIIEATRRRTNI
jgi:hypothetical protein